MEFWNFGRGLITASVLFITALILLYFYLERKYRYWPRRGIKSLTLWESLRKLPRLFTQPTNEDIIKAYNKYGRLFGMYGPYPQLWVAEPEILKQILVKDFNVFRNRLKVEFGEEMIQKMIFMLCDEDWRRIRCIISPTFSSGKMRKMALLVRECANNAAKFFQTLADKGEECNIKEHFGSFAVDVIATTAFATKINSLHDPDNEFLANARTLSNKDISGFESFIAMMAPRFSKWFNIEIIPSEPLRYYRRLVMKIAKEREKTKIKGHDFLQLMIDAKEDFTEISANEPERNENKDDHAKNLPKHRTMTMDEVVSQCINFFIAGHDATAVSLSYAAYHLALNPDCQEKLANEIQTTLEKHGEFDFDAVSKMPYLEAVLHESLRISATSSTLMRLCAEDYTVENIGITIPKGTVIIIPTSAIHLDPEWFPEPHKFNPDRFLPENKHKIKPFTYLPFGDGPRNCIGMRFVMMTMKLCLCYLLKDLRFVATEETQKPLDYYIGQGLTQAKRIPMKLEKR